MTEKELLIELKKLNIDLTEDTLETLRIYNDFLLEYNKHTNLTAIKEKEEVYLKHFYDSLTLTKIIKLESQKILDVGTGAGFPGFVLAIVYPNIQVTLLDSNNKKTTFLKLCIEKLNLKNVEVVHSRAEEYARNNREQFDIVTARAVANLTVLSEITIPMVKVNGFFIAMKAQVEEEIKESKEILQNLSAEIQTIYDFKLPKEESIRTLIKIKKIKKTLIKYPRSIDKIKSAK